MKKKVQRKENKVKDQPIEDGEVKMTIEVKRNLRAIAKEEMVKHSF
jgi:hypothetical protein